MGLPCVLPGQSNPASVSAPVLGYVFETGAGALRPVLGIPGTSLIGQPLDPGLAISDIAISPRHKYALAIAGGQHKATLLALGQANAAVSAIDGTESGLDHVFLSPSGSAAVLYRIADSLVQIVTGLPDSPVIRGSIAGFDPGGAIESLAISDDGAEVLAAVQSGQTGFLVSLALDGTFTQLPVAGPISAMAFRPHTHDAVVTNRRDSQISIVRDVGGSAEYRFVAGQNDGVADPLAAEFSGNGSRVFVANAEAGDILVLDLAGGPPIPVSCQCALTALQRLNDNSVFRLNDLSNNPLMLFDGGSAQPRVVFVPSDSQRSSQ